MPTCAKLASTPKAGNLLRMLTRPGWSGSWVCIRWQCRPGRAAGPGWLVTAVTDAAGTGPLSRPTWKRAADPANPAG